jgi:hypothetical protein
VGCLNQVGLQIARTHKAIYQKTADLTRRLHAIRSLTRLAADTKKPGVRPGIRLRPTALMTVTDRRLLRAVPVSAREKPPDWLDTRNQPPLDSLKLIARNAFYLALEPFKTAYNLL